MLGDIHETLFAPLTPAPFSPAACPSTQTPVSATDLTGDWSGTLTHADGQNVAIPLTVTFTQTDNDLGGTASLGPVLYQSTGEVTGSVEGTVTFAFSYVASESSIGGEVERTMGTYTFTALLDGNTLSGDVVGTIEGADLSFPGTFTLERQ